MDNIKAVPVVITENTSVYDAIVTLFLTDVGTLLLQVMMDFYPALFHVRTCSK